MPKIPRQQDDALETLGALAIMLAAILTIIASISVFVWLAL